MADENGDICVDGDCSSGKTCFKHKLKTLQWSTQATPSRRNQIPPKTAKNSWEKGIARDFRGMPIIGASGSPIGVHEFASRRHDIEAQLDRQRHTPAASPTPTP